jgi:parvulin-like peptidyl-prolyl isomerase
MEFIAKEEIKNLNPDEKFKYFKAHEEEFLEKLIDTRLQIEEAERYGIFVTDAEIESSINDIKKKYGLTDEAFSETLKKEGMSFSDYKKMLKEQIIIGRTVNSLVRSKIVITDADINSYISAHPELVCDDEGYYVSQIFLKKRESEEELKEKLNEIFKRLIQGEPFSRVASQLSEDSSAKTGGAIGILKKREIASQLSSLFSKMSVGQISEPLMTEQGVFIFKLDGVCFKKGSVELTNYVRSIIEDERFKKDYKLWLRGLRQRAYIEIMD